MKTASEYQEDIADLQDEIDRLNRKNMKLSLENQNLKKLLNHQDKPLAALLKPKEQT